MIALSLVKQERLWYTAARKALLSFTKRAMLCLLAVFVCCNIGCAPPEDRTERDFAEESGFDEDETDGSMTVTFSMPSSSGEMREETFVQVGASKHAVAYVSAHGAEDGRVHELLEAYEETIFPALPLQIGTDEEQLTILITYLEGKVYGYMREAEQGPVIVLNALYADDFEYVLAHEHQHLCAYEAGKAEGTMLSAETDELLSDMFCERLYPGYGTAQGILSEERAAAARERLEHWGEDGLLHVYDLLRAGYAEEGILSAVEDR